MARLACACLLLLVAAAFLASQFAFSPQVTHSDPEPPLEIETLAFPPRPFDGLSLERPGQPCDDVPCWIPVTSAEECERRCVCAWMPGESPVCQCTPNHMIPACQHYFPRPSTLWLERLAHGGSDVTSRDRILMLGDSVTWLGGYEALLRIAFAHAGTAVTITNRAVNGAEIHDVLRGHASANYTTLAMHLAVDKPTIVTVLIGFNDYDDSEDEFKGNLTEIVELVLASGATPVLATIMTSGEKTPGTQKDDAQTEELCAWITAVGQQFNAAVASVRARTVAYEHAHNNVVPGGLEWGILTTDTVHPCQSPHSRRVPCPAHTHGNYLIADAFAEALIAATAARKAKQAP